VEVSNAFGYQTWNLTDPFAGASFGTTQVLAKMNSPISSRALPPCGERQHCVVPKHASGQFARTGSKHQNETGFDVPCRHHQNAPTAQRSSRCGRSEAAPRGIHTVTQKESSHSSRGTRPCGDLQKDNEIMPTFSRSSHPITGVRGGDTFPTTHFEQDFGSRIGPLKANASFSKGQAFFQPVPLVAAR
jgi:hypothetical protein